MDPRCWRTGVVAETAGEAGLAPTEGLCAGRASRANDRLLRACCRGPACFAAMRVPNPTVGATPASPVFLTTMPLSQYLASANVCGAQGERNLSSGRQFAQDAQRLVVEIDPVR